MGWRGVLAVASALSLGAAGCTGTTSDSPRAVVACSLLTTTEAGHSMGEAASVQRPQASLPPKESFCLWQGTALSTGASRFPPVFMLTVRWDHSSLTAFEAVHDGIAPITYLSDKPIALPTYIPAEVDGTRSYWTMQQQVAPGGGPQEVLTSTKDGYVV